MLQKPDIIEKTQKLLGNGVAKAFQEAILESCDALEMVMKKIDSFLAVGADNNGYLSKMNVLNSINFGSAEEVKVRYRQGFKLALSSKEIEDCIAKVDRATKILNSIRSAKSDMQWIESRDTKKGLLKKLIRPLIGIRDYASQLHQSIWACWTREGCNSVHQVNFHLQDRIESQNEEDSIQFKLVFMAKTQNTLNSRQSLVKVFKQNEGDGSLVDLQEQLNRVRFEITPSQTSSTAVIGSEVSDICLEVCKAQKTAGDILQLCLQPRSSNQYRIRKLASQEASAGIRNTHAVISLAEILQLSNNRNSRFRLFPQASTELALILASGVLQLSKAPWFVESWTKNQIFFLNKDPSIPPESLDSWDVDITQPLATKVLPEEHVSEGRQQPIHPINVKKVLLEYAIVLLELWHEVSIEERFGDRLHQVNGDYLGRKHLTERWLEDTDMLGFQFDVIANCLRHLQPSSEGTTEPKWDDETFLQSFAVGVVEPLCKESNKSRTYSYIA